MKTREILERIIEENADYEYYTECANNTDNEEHKQHYTAMANDELKHRDWLIKMHPEVAEEVDKKINYYTEIKNML